MPVPPNTHAAESIPEAAREEIDRLLGSGDLFRYNAAENAPVTLLETEFAEMMGSRYALAVSSCSGALFLALKALDLPRDARVMIPGFTFAAVPSAVVHADCQPVLCEVGANYRIDLADFEAKLAGVSAVIISHMRGHTSDMDAIMSLCEARGIPVIEDAAHSLGTSWRGRRIGTIGQIGCFSFQSYKMVNSGEGGIMVTDDAELAARAIIMSGAYEHMWKKHKPRHGENSNDLTLALESWQNKLPLYNMRLSNMSATIARAQLPEVPRRIRDGRRNHDMVAALISESPWISVPAALEGEERAPDSLQFNLEGVDDDQTRAFQDAAAARGVKVQVFGMSADNARAFWNWQFIQDLPELPQTRAMLMRACDCRLPARLTPEECQAVADALVAAARDVMDKGIVAAAE